MVVMARVIGSSFRRPFMVQPRQESSLERNLAQFASPQGVYLLAKGLGSLGGVSLPWGGSEGGVDKTKLAASARAKAMQTVQDSTQKIRSAKARVGPPLGAVSDETQRLAQSQDKERDMNPRLNEYDLTSPDVPAGERDRLTNQEMEIVRATQEGRPVRDIRESNILTGARPDQEQSDLNSLVGIDFEALEDEEIVDIASQIGARNKALVGNAQKFMRRMVAQGQDPSIVMHAIAGQREELKKYNNKVREELQRRTEGAEKELTRIEGAPESEFDAILSMSPNEQRAEIRRLAKGSKTEADKERVRDLTRRHVPEVATFGDLFTSESDRRKEFDTEVEELFPVIDPFYTEKKRKYRTDELLGQQRIAESGAQAQRWAAMSRTDKEKAASDKAKALREAAKEERQILADATDIEVKAAQVDKIRAEVKKMTGPQKKKKSGRTKEVAGQVKASAQYLDDGGVKLNRELGRMLNASGGSLTNQQVEDLYDKFGLADAIKKHAVAARALRKARVGDALQKSADKKVDDEMAERMKRMNPGALVLGDH